jgi:hypothetical protein
MLKVQYPGADMTNETTKVLLMSLIKGSHQVVIHISKIRASQHWALLSRAMAHVWSAVILTDRVLQPAIIKCKSHKRQLGR